MLNITVFVVKEVFIHVFLLYALWDYVHHLKLFLVVHVHAQTLTVCCVVALVVRIMPHFHQTLIQILSDPFLPISIFMHFQILPKFLLIKLLPIQLTLSLYLFPNPKLSIINILNTFCHILYLWRLCYFCYLVQLMLFCLELNCVA